MPARKLRLGRTSGSSGTKRKICFALSDAAIRPPSPTSPTIIHSVSTRRQLASPTHSSFSRAVTTRLVGRDSSPRAS